jgi:hypothetical protein
MPTGRAIARLLALVLLIGITRLPQLTGPRLVPDGDECILGVGALGLSPANRAGPQVLRRPRLSIRCQRDVLDRPEGDGGGLRR